MYSLDGEWTQLSAPVILPFESVHNKVLNHNIRGVRKVGCFSSHSPGL